MRPYLETKGKHGKTANKLAPNKWVTNGELEKCGKCNTNGNAVQRIVKRAEKCHSALWMQAGCAPPAPPRSKVP